MMLENNFKPGDKVKINLNAFEWQKKELAPNFLEWINQNADTVFTLKAHKENSVLWEFEENDTWLFYFGNLTKV